MNHRWVEKIVWSLLALLTLVGCGILIWILSVVLGKGLPAINPGFLFQESRDFGSEGGVAFQIVGTLILMTGAVVLSLPIALGSALFQTEFLESERLKKAFRGFLYSLNGVPTILFGLVGYLFFGVYLEAGVSWLTGVLILGAMILPTLHVSIQQAIESLPEKYRDSGMALGLSPWAQIRSIIIPQSVFGIVTGVLLGLARAAGETAAILFTATTFSGTRFPLSWTDPVPTLQTHILVLAQDAVNPQATTNAWGAGLVLLTLVFLLIIASLALRGRMSMEAER